MEKIWWMFLKSFGWPFWFPFWVQKIVPGPPRPLRPRRLCRYRVRTSKNRNLTAPAKSEEGGKSLGILGPG